MELLIFLGGMVLVALVTAPVALLGAAPFLDNWGQDFLIGACAYVFVAILMMRR